MTGPVMLVFPPPSCSECLTMVHTRADGTYRCESCRVTWTVTDLPGVHDGPPREKAATAFLQAREGARAYEAASVKGVGADDVLWPGI